MTPALCSIWRLDRSFRSELLDYSGEVFSTVNALSGRILGLQYTTKFKSSSYVPTEAFQTVDISQIKNMHQNPSYNWRRFWNPAIFVNGRPSCIGFVAFAPS
jgi:hypothetical protein